MPALAITTNEPTPSSTDKTGAEATASLYDAMGIGSNPAAGNSRISPSLQMRVNKLDPNAHAETIPAPDLPRCPRCNELLRPAVVWFNEPLDKDMITSINKWIDDADSIDLMLVIGTAAAVYPAAGYISQARAKGARVAVINMDGSDLGATGSLNEQDFMFVGDSGVIVPYVLKEVIGELDAESHNVSRDSEA